MFYLLLLIVFCACFHIFQIERIENYYLFEHYQVAKSHVSRVSDPGVEVERQLWHGTAKDALNNIYAGGFNRSYCGKNGKFCCVTKILELACKCQFIIALLQMNCH